MTNSDGLSLRIPKAETRVVLFTPEGQEDRIGSFSPLVFACADVEATYTELKERGVAFDGPPEKQPWGTFVEVSRQRRESVCSGNFKVTPATARPCLSQLVRSVGVADLVDIEPALNRVFGVRLSLPKGEGRVRVCWGALLLKLPRSQVALGNEPVLAVALPQ